MRKSLATVLLSAALVGLLVLLVVTSLFTIRVTSGDYTLKVSGAQVSPVTSGQQLGLVEEAGNIFYYYEVGSPFTGGYKALVTDGHTDYYYFLPNGQAFTGGYKALEVDGQLCYFYFEEDGKAFTGGLKEVTLGQQTHTYYFQPDGRAMTSVWLELPQGLCYFQANGRAVRDDFLTLDGRSYYFDEEGALVTGGWFALDREQAFYYADPSGVLATDTVVEGYRLDETGRSATKYRINQYVNAHTEPTMSNEEKIRALYDWVLHNDMVYIRTYEHTRSDWVWKDSWVDDMAAQLMDTGGGNCFRYAAFMGMLIREATGLPVNVCRGHALTGGVYFTSHSWCTVLQDDQWYIYDVELQKFAEVTSAICYKVPADDSYMHHNAIATPLYS